MAYDIEKIIKIFDESNIAKMELEVEGIKIKLEKNLETNEVNIIKEELEEGTKVLAPVFGTYYSNKTSKTPYVKKGSKVKKGDILCIIEAMKVMNEVTSPVDGTIVNIYSKNEDVVEYDQVLFLIG